VLKSPLKGILKRKGAQREPAKPPPAPDPPPGTGFKVCRQRPVEQPGARHEFAHLKVGRELGRRGASKRLVMLVGWIRGADGKCVPVRTRAMLDSGATECFASPRLLKSMGVEPEHGQFGVAVEAFGKETPLTKRLRDAELVLEGVNGRSGLAHQFRTRWNFIVADLHGYDIILGTNFLDYFGGNVVFSREGPRRINLTDDAGAQIQIPEAEEEGATLSTDTGWQQLVNALTRKERKPRSAKPLTNGQQRMVRRESGDDSDWRKAQAERGASERPELVMRFEDFIKQYTEGTARGEKWNVHAIMSTGFVPLDELEGLPEDARARGPNEPEPVRLCRVTVRKGVATVATVEQRGLGAEAQLSEAEQERAEATTARLVKEYKPVFASKLPGGIPPKRGPEDFRIETKPGTQPFGRYGSRMTPEDTKKAGEMLAELLTDGFIRPSRSPWGAPMFLVDKPDGGKRMVIDYRALNAQTIRNRYPLPRVDELFDQLQGAAYFSKIDLRTGYWQIRVAAEDVPKTAFTSRHGHFEWLVMPMGLTNAPAEFMRLMEDTFREELDKFVLVFLDDILIYSRTFEEHEQHIRVVLERLKQQKLFAKLSKCSFFKAEVEFLGHYVGRAGVRMIDGKVSAVQDWPTPTTQKEVEQFLGLAGYYRRFIADFSTIAAPLSELTGTLRKDKKGAVRKPPKKAFRWGTQQEDAFAALKTAVSTAPCLTIPDASKEFVVHTDASGYATGAVLMQNQGEGLRPIAFLSKKMTAAETRYPVHEQELLAILHALRAWRHYLGGRHFTVLSDHQSLQYVQTSAMATPRQQRWAALLSEFDFSIQYAKGEDNVAADALSRGAAGKAGESAATAAPEETLLLTAITGRAHEMGNIGPMGQGLLGALRAWRRPKSTARERATHRLASVEALPPLAVRIKEVAAADPDYMDLLDEVRYSDADLDKFNIERGGGLLYRRIKAQDGKPAAVALMIPNHQKLRNWLLRAAHDDPSAGHRSASKTAAFLQGRVWWPGLRGEAARYVAGCEQCQKNKPDNRGRMGMPRSLSIPENPWETICVDFTGPFPASASGHDMIMVVIDKLTRYVHYIPTRMAATAQDTFQLFREQILSHHGLPRHIVSDRDSKFTSQFWADIWEQHGTELLRSTSYHPQTDGATERQNRTMIEALRSFVDGDQRNWATLLPCLEEAHNDAVNASTGFSPFYMNNGRERRTVMDADLEQQGARRRPGYPGARQLAEAIKQASVRARETILRAQAKQRADSARHGRRESTVRPGDRVWLSSEHIRKDAGPEAAQKLMPRWYGPFEVEEMRGSNAAKLKLPAGWRIHPVFNTDRLREFNAGDAAHAGDRPVRHDRQDPVSIDEHGEPEWEVESVINRRKRRGRWEYRVVWKGWPIESATWEKEDNLTSCAEAVQEFLRRQAHVLIVACIRDMPRLCIQERTLRAREWGRIDAYRTPRVESPVSTGQLASIEQRAALAPVAALDRQQARTAARTNTPLQQLPQRPAVNRKTGAIHMDSQRCTADRKKGGQCGLRTRHGELCWQHLLARDGLRIKKSTVLGAGLGLFKAKRDIRAGEVLTDYTGDYVPVSDDTDFGGSRYVLELTERLAIDAARTNAAPGRLVNDARGSGRRPNARFSCNQRAKTATVRSTKTIKAGEEILVSYGASFWNQGPAAKRGPIKVEPAALQRPRAAGDSAQRPIIVDNIQTGQFKLNGADTKVTVPVVSKRKLRWADNGDGSTRLRRVRTFLKEESIEAECARRRTAAKAALTAVPPRRICTRREGCNAWRPARS
jgi:hypothetical protein